MLAAAMERKHHAILLPLVCLAGLFAVSPAATGATNEIRFCRHTPGGWEITAGNLPPKIPFTSCRFSKATFRQAKSRKKNLTHLRRHFRMRVRGVRLSCHAFSRPGYAEFRCRAPGYFVLVYRF